MQIEIEKKYELTNADYDIIKEKCKFVGEQELKDYYLDDKNFSLFKHEYYLRIRNGKYELKIHSFDEDTKTATAQEYDNEDIINEKLKEFDLTIDDSSGVLFVHTKREKYSYEFQGYTFSIDIDRYQYDSRYEIELVFDNETGVDGGKLIDELRDKLWLTSESGIEASKVATCAMHQSIPLYEILTK